MQFKINLGKRLTIKKVIMQVVVVGKPDNDRINGKNPLDITIGVFFDGTLNNRGVKIIS
jgi:hypothetical protein